MSLVERHADGLGEELRQIRSRGYAGGVIRPHRAMVTLRYERSRLLASAALALGIFVAWLAVLNRVSAAWEVVLRFWQEVLGLGGAVTAVSYSLLGLYDFHVPYLVVPCAHPGPLQLQVGVAATLLVLLATFLLPRWLMPLIYFLRVVVFFHATAQIYFAFWGSHFPYEASSYVHGMLIAGLAFISLMPIMFGITYFVFDFGVGKKLGITLLTMLHLSLFLPMQFMAHAFLLHHFSLLVMPVLFLVFGLTVEVMIFITFYGLGMSWKSSLTPDHVPPEPRR